MADKCKERIRGKGRWGSFNRVQCTRDAVKDGYCKQHHPDSVKARFEKSQAKWDAEREESAKKAREQMERDRRAECFDEVVVALQLLLASVTHADPNGWHETVIHKDDIAKARAALEKAKGQ